MIEPLAHDDPPTAFWEAHRRGEDVRLHTSGTSGGRRAIVRSTASWVGSFDACARRWGLGSESVVWVPGPMAATMNLFAACLAGHAGARWQVERSGATHAALTPAQLRVLLDADPPRGLHALVAGDTLEPGLRRLAATHGVRTSHYYGAAELSLVAWGEDAASLRLFDGVEAQVRGDGAGPGVLWVRSPWLSRLDLVDVEHDGAGFATVGDLAELRADRLRLLGRPGSVTTAGATVETAPLEAMLQRRAAGRVVLVGIPDARVGEVLCCVAPSDELAGLRDWARRHLTGARRPRRWVARDELPSTPTGKLDRAALVRELARQSAPVDHGERS